MYYEYEISGQLGKSRILYRILLASKPGLIPENNN